MDSREELREMLHSRLERSRAGCSADAPQRLQRSLRLLPRTGLPRRLLRSTLLRTLPRPTDEE